MGFLGLQIAVVVVLLFMSGYFSSTETAYYEINKSRIKTLAEKEDKKAKRVLKLLEHEDRLFSTILLGNNIANLTIASICVLIFVDLIENKGIATLIACVVTCLVILFFGEIIPKTVAKEQPEKIAMNNAGFIRFMMIVLSPLCFIFNLVRKVLSKIAKPKDDRRMTQDELLDFVDEVEQEGGRDEQEIELLRSAIEFPETEASDILTPRTVLQAIEDTATNEEISALFSETGFSRLPVYTESIDNIKGIIHIKDFYGIVNGTDKSIDTILKKPVYIPLSMKISDIFKLLKKMKSHIAIVVDEYGGTKGIVTMEDILEELVGEIWDEHDEVVEDMTQISEDKYEVLCSMELDKLLKTFDLEDEETKSATVSGWILEKFGCLPKVGDSFDFENIHIEVTDAGGQNVTKAEVTVIPKQEEDSDDEEEQKEKSKDKKNKEKDSEEESK